MTAEWAQQHVIVRLSRSVRKEILHRHPASTALLPVALVVLNFTVFQRPEYH